MSELKKIQEFHFPNDDNTYILAPDVKNVQNLKTITVNPNTINDAIKNALPNTVIELEEGDYGILQLTSKEKIDDDFINYPKDLTIIGKSENCIIQGVYITSNFKYDDLEPAIKLDDTNDYQNINNSLSILPEGLTIKKVTFRNAPFVLVNCAVNNLTIDSCKFENTYIQVEPNQLNIGDEEINRPEESKLQTNNLTIKNNSFVGSNNNFPAIQLSSINNITIHNNKIEYTTYGQYGINIGKSNAIQAGAKQMYSSGNILITNNYIKNSVYEAFHLENIENANIFINSNNCVTQKECNIYYKNIKNTNFNIFNNIRGNEKYDNCSPPSSDIVIYEENISKNGYVIGKCRKWLSGWGEIWLVQSMPSVIFKQSDGCISISDGQIINDPLPFQFYNIIKCSVTPIATDSNYAFYACVTKINKDYTPNYTIISPYSSLPNNPSIDVHFYLAGFFKK